MKQLIILFALTGLFLFPLKAFSQQPSPAQDKQAQVVAMMKDSAMVSQMMKEIASNDQLRKMMVNQMMATVKSDTAKMKQMCAMMTADKPMCDMMLKTAGCCCTDGPGSCATMKSGKGKGMKAMGPKGKSKSAAPKK